MKLAFCTTVVIGFDCIKELIIIGYKLEFIITLEDDYLPNKSGRVSLNSLAEKHSIDLIKVKNINQSVVVNALKERSIDYFFVIGWSQIASVEVVKAVNKFVIGAHPTLLPKGRGRAAIPWTILKGLKCSGVTFFKIDDKVDTGEPYPGAYLDFGDYQIIIWSGGKKQLSDNDLQLKFKDGYYYAHDWSKR